jgi:hypothetical protein
VSVCSCTMPSLVNHHFQNHWTASTLRVN